jgi:phospholipid/cholesterol/gamma-HCH transport system permease protein
MSYQTTAFPTPQRARRTPASGGPPSGLRDGTAHPINAVRTLGSALAQFGDMMFFLVEVVKSAAIPPYTWFPDFIDQSWIVLKRCLIPMVFVVFVFGYGAPGLQGVDLLNAVGSVDRLGAFFTMASFREFAPWTNGMVIAGIAGTAMCADLGARKVREEIEALESMGIDPIKSLVVPRFCALGFMTVFFSIVAGAVGVVGGLVAATWSAGESTAGYVATFSSTFTLAELFGDSLKVIINGFIIGLVCCYMGLNVKGGAEGVGRAVNRAVVISFVGIWVFNYMATIPMLSLFPQIEMLR